MNRLRGWLGFLVMLLFLELETLVFTQEQLRTELRALFRVPVYHVLLAFGLLLLITWRIRPTSLRGAGLVMRPKWLGLHVILYISLGLSLPHLKEWTARALDGAALITWGLIGLSLLSSWLSCWLRLERQRIVPLFRLLSALLIMSLALTTGAQLTSDSWDSLAGRSFHTAHFVLSVLFSDSLVDSRLHLLGTSRFQVEVQPGCSGYEGIGLMFFLMLFYVYLKRQQLGPRLRPGRALLLVLGSLLLSWTANILRLVALVALGTLYSPELAVGSFHTQAGWLLFSCIGLLLIGLSEQCAFLEAGSVRYEYPALAYLAPLLTVMLATLFTEAFRQQFDLYYPLRPLLAGLCLLHFCESYSGLWGRPSLAAVVTGVGAYLLWLLLIPVQTAAPPQISGAWAWIAARVFGSVLIAPLSEELAFRGYLLRRFQQSPLELNNWPIPRLLPLILSSALFGLIHQQWLAGFLVGLLYGRLVGPESRLSNAVLAHAVTNFCLSVQVLLCQRWDLWV